MAYKKTQDNKNVQLITNTSSNITGNISNTENKDISDNNYSIIDNTDNKIQIQQKIIFSNPKKGFLYLKDNILNKINFNNIL